MAANAFLDVYTFSTEEIRDIKELVIEQFLNAPDLNFLHTMYSGIVTDKEIGFIGEGGIVGKAGTGCTKIPQDWTIGSRKLTWHPKQWEIFLEECKTDLENTMVTYAMKNGVDRFDLTDTDYMSIVTDVLSLAVKKMIWRIIWFNDTLADNFVDGGIITNGIDPGYFNIIDGLWKQFQLAIVAHPELGVAIAANAEATKALQKSALTPDLTNTMFENMLDAAPIELRDPAKASFFVTQSIADKYARYLKGKGIDATYINLVEGITALKYDGYNVIPMPIWDEMIAKYNVTGTKVYKMHRAILIEKENLGVGTPSTGVIEDFKIWYSDDKFSNFIYAADKIDALLLNDQRFVLAI